MDKQSGETEEEEVIGEVVGESELEELIPEWGWRRDKGSWSNIPQYYARRRKMPHDEEPIGQQSANCACGQNVHMY